MSGSDQSGDGAFVTPSSSSSSSGGGSQSSSMAAATASPTATGKARCHAAAIRLVSVRPTPSIVAKTGFESQLRRGEPNRGATNAYLAGSQLGGASFVGVDLRSTSFGNAPNQSGVDLNGANMIAFGRGLERGGQ